MWLRIWAMCLRYVYLHKRSVARFMEIFFWPMMNLFLWGFLTIYMRNLNAPAFVVYLLGGIIFWDLLYRAQQSVTLSISEEMWTRNVINIFIAPLRPVELLTSVCLIGLLKVLLTMTLMSVIAWLMYGFNILDLGFDLVLFFGSLLIFGWAVGLFTMGIIFYYGRATEALAWGVPFLIQPFSAIFYPVSVMPAWMRAIAYLLPSTYVFEGMRGVLAGQGTDWHALAVSYAMNGIYLLAGGLYFAYTLRKVRVIGGLSRQVTD